MSNALPLEKRVIVIDKDGVERSIPALSKAWAKTREWMPYVSPPSVSELKIFGAEETWLERTSMVVEDLDLLLQMPHHQFWSQLAYDRLLHRHLGKLLQRLPRPYEDNSFYGDTIVESLNLVMTKTFLVFMRTSTYKETADHHITPEFFANLLYDNFLLDIPRIMDICVVFHPGNPVIVEKMISNVFIHCSAYQRDLITASYAIQDKLKQTENELDPSCKPTCLMSVEDDLENILDLVLYVTDILCTIRSFFFCSQSATRIMCQAVSLCQGLSSLYQNALIPTCLFFLNQKAREPMQDEMPSVAKGLVLLQMARCACIDSYRKIVEATSLSFLSTEIAAGSKGGEADHFLDMLTNTLSDFIFIVDYDRKYSVRDDIEMIRQFGVELDSLRTQYILEGLERCKTDVSSETVAVGKDSSPKVEETPSNEVVNGACSIEVDVESKDPSVGLVSQVAELFPYLGAGFILKCLEYFDNSPEKVINSLLEDNLPPHLSAADRTLGIPEPKIDEVKMSHQEEPQAGRANMYDGDEFDVNFSDVVDRSKIRKGKKNRYGKGSSLIDDKQDLVEMKERYSALGIVVDEEIVVPGAKGGHEYDDEYDDTYEDIPRGQKEPDAADELLARRPFVLPQALGGGKIVYVRKAISDDSEESDTEGDKSRRHLNFVRNPEEIRQEAERKRAEKQSQKMKNKATPPIRDVVGKAKGQGQDKQVLINRSRKNVNKGKGHRNAADKKMSKGMF